MFSSYQGCDVKRRYQSGTFQKKEVHSGEKN